MKTFDTVAKLKLAKLKEGQFVDTGGYYVKGDGGAARYLIVTPQSFDGYGDHELANGNIAVLQGNTLYAEQFGAKGDGTNDYPSLNAMKEYANSETMMELDGTKTYCVEQEWELRHSTNVAVGAKLKGNGATIKALNAMPYVVSISGATKLNTAVSDLVINANNLATTGWYASFVVEMNSYIKGIKVLNAVGDGQLYDGCQVAKISQLVSQSCGGVGVVAESCNGARFDTVRVILCEDGMRVRRGSTGFSGGCSILNLDAEINNGYGFVDEDTTSTTEVTGWFESNGKDGALIKAAARNTHIHDTNVIGEEGAGSYRAIRIEDGALGCKVEQNLFNKLSGSDDFSKVEDENTSNTLFNEIGSNWFGTQSKLATTGRSKYFNDSLVRQLSTSDVIGKGGELSGGEVYVIPASGSLTFTWQPYGVFNVAGAGSRGVYAIELKIIGYFAGFDQAAYKEYLVYSSTGNGADHSQSSTEIQSVGNTRRNDITVSAPVTTTLNEISIVISNADTTDFTGTFNFGQMMTTKGTLVLTVT